MVDGPAPSGDGDHEYWHFAPYDLDPAVHSIRPLRSCSCSSSTVTDVKIVSSAFRNAATFPLRQCKCTTVSHTLLHNECWPLTPDNPQVSGSISVRCVFLHYCTFFSTTPLDISCPLCISEASAVHAPVAYSLVDTLFSCMLVCVINRLS